MDFINFHEHITKEKNDKLLTERIYRINGIPYGTEPHEVGTIDPSTGQKVRERYSTGAARRRTAKNIASVDPTYTRSSEYQRAMHTDDPNVIHARKKAKEFDDDFQQWKARGYSDRAPNIYAPGVDGGSMPNAQGVASNNPVRFHRTSSGRMVPLPPAVASTSGTVLDQPAEVPNTSQPNQQGSVASTSGQGYDPNKTKATRVSASSQNVQQSGKDRFANKDYTAYWLSTSEDPKHKFWGNKIKNMSPEEYQKIYSMSPQERSQYFTTNYPYNDQFVGK